MHNSTAPHVVIVGGGFGGLRAAQTLAKGYKADVVLTVIDRRSYHVFTPLLYQVATSSLSPGEIAVPIRSQFRNAKNVRCLMAEVASIDVNDHQLRLRNGESLRYDYLVIAAGAQSHYFGNEKDWAPHVETLDDLASAEKLRDRLILAFEAAERESDPEKRSALLTFCILGAGPSGVELAGAIADLGRRVLAKEYRQITPQDVHVILFEAQDRVLPPFSPESSHSAKQQLESLGVDVRLNEKVSAVNQGEVVTDSGVTACSLICWGSGVRAVDLAQSLSTPKASGRLVVNHDCSLPDHPNVFAVGDIAAFESSDGTMLPGLAPVAMQQGNHAAECILADIAGKPRSAFTYKDRGIMATIGRSRAVVESGKHRLSGGLAWLSWLLLHVFYLIGFRARALVLLEWCWAYIGHTRGSRLVETERRSVDSVLAQAKAAPGPNRAGRRSPPPLPRSRPAVRVTTQERAH